MHEEGGLGMVKVQEDLGEEAGGEGGAGGGEVHRRGAGGARPGHRARTSNTGFQQTIP